MTSGASDVIRARVQQPREVDASAVQRLLGEGAYYLDVRTVEEFELGHVPGAFNVPVDHGSTSGLTANPDFDAVVSANFPRSQHLVVGCHSGGRAARALTRLAQLGFDHLWLHRSGWNGAPDAFGRRSPGWVASGCQVERKFAPEQAYAELQRRHRS